MNVSALCMFEQDFVSSGKIPSMHFSFPTCDWKFPLVVSTKDKIVKGQRVWRIFGSETHQFRNYETSRMNFHRVIRPCSSLTDSQALILRNTINLSKDLMTLRH